MEEKNIDFIKLLNNLRLSTICKSLHIDRINLYNKKSSIINIREVKNELIIRCKIIEKYLTENKEYFLEGGLEVVGYSSLEECKERIEAFNQLNTMCGIEEFYAMYYIKNNKIIKIGG